MVHFTDYSAGRKTPLETAIRTASTLEGAERVVAAWIEENVKKGWGEVGANPTAAKPAEKEAEEAAPPKRSRAKKPPAT